MRFDFRLLCTTWMFLGLLACQTATEKPAEVISPTENKVDLPRSTPESQGISSGTILNLLEAIDSSGLEFHSIMILRHDTVIAEGWWSPYRSEYKHTLYSLSKSFTSTAIGFAVQEGLISVGDKVVSFFPDDLPDSVSEKMADMEIRDLLTMTTGHATGTLPVMVQQPMGNWPKGFLAQELTYKPGEHFMYNTGATYMLSAILQKKTGETVLNYLQPRLFAPLGIEGMDWEEDPMGVNVGGYGLRVNTEDIAKFGLLYLNKGIFNGERLLSEEWVDEATGYRTSSQEGDSDWSQGYGYQFWRSLPDNSYRGDGAFGQFCLILPDQDMVVAITSESKDMQASMRLIWDNLLPGVEEGKLAGDPEGYAALQEKEEQLNLSREELTKDGGNFTGEILALQENDLGINAIELDLRANQFIIYGRDTLNMSFGWNVWEANKTRTSIPMGAKVDSEMAIRGGWNTDGQFVIERQFIETAHYDRFRFTFDGKLPKVTWNESVSLWTEGNQGRSLVLVAR